MKGNAAPARLVLSSEMLSLLLPMHLLVSAQGIVLGAGPTARKMLSGDRRLLSDDFVVTRPAGNLPVARALALAARGDDRIEMRMAGSEQVRLRGRVVRLTDGMFLLNVGFGISLPEAVGVLRLNDADFPAGGLAMEYMFLYEANREVMRELSHFNLLLNDARCEAEIRAQTDSLTGLRNRRGLEIALDMALDATRGCEEARIGAGFAVMQLDLDHFKEVNDLHGHAAGDEVLRHVGHVLDEVTRDSDVAARVGGDEFVLILHGVTKHASLRRLGQRIIGKIMKPVEFDGGCCHVSASIGAAISINYENPTAEQLLADADAALYSSKRNGRGKVTIPARSSRPALSSALATK